jgi:hypothetical protein
VVQVQVVLLLQVVLLVRVVFLNSDWLLKKEGDKQEQKR